MTIEEKMHNQSIYWPSDEKLMQEQALCLEKLYDFNATRPSEYEKRIALLKEMFAEIGDNCYIEPPLHANWGGKHVHFGNNVYANFNLTIVDDTHVFVGDCTLIAPNVILATGTHPILPELREKGYQFNAPIKIGRNCWIGAGAIVLPGVTIGDNSVIGAGSVVTKDVPDWSFAAGNPCRVIRPITKEDQPYYFKDQKIKLEYKNEYK